MQLTVKCCGFCMFCKNCDRLLWFYQHLVRSYANTTQAMAGVGGSDLRRVLVETERLRSACLEASDRLMEHWRDEHNP